MAEYLKHHSYIIVKYIFNNEEYSVRLDMSNKIILFINVIELSKKIKFKDYDLYYRKDKIYPIQYEKTMKDIVRTDTSPSF